MVQKPLSRHGFSDSLAPDLPMGDFFTRDRTATIRSPRRSRQRSRMRARATIEIVKARSNEQDCGRSVHPKRGSPEAGVHFWKKGSSRNLVARHRLPRPIQRGGLSRHVLLRPVILPFILESLAIHVPEITDSSSNGVDLSDDASERTVLAASFER